MDYDLRRRNDGTVEVCIHKDVPALYTPLLDADESAVVRTYIPQGTRVSVTVQAVPETRRLVADHLKLLASPVGQHSRSRTLEVCFYQRVPDAPAPIIGVEGCALIGRYFGPGTRVTVAVRALHPDECQMEGIAAVIDETGPAFESRPSFLEAKDATANLPSRQAEDAPSRDPFLPPVDVVPESTQAPQEPPAKPGVSKFSRVLVPPETDTSEELIHVQSAADVLASVLAAYDSGYVHQLIKAIQHAKKWRAWRNSLPILHRPCAECGADYGLHFQHCSRCGK